MLVYWKVSSSYDSAQDSLAEWSPWKSNHSRRMHRGISAETPIPTGSAWNLLGSRMGNVKSTGLGLRNFKHFLPCHGLGKSLHPASSSVTLQSCCKDNAWESVFWTLQWPVNLGSSRCNSQKVQGLGQCMWLWTPDGRRAFSMPAVQKLSDMLCFSVEGGTWHMNSHHKNHIWVNVCLCCGDKKGRKPSMLVCACSPSYWRG